MPWTRKCLLSKLTYSARVHSSSYWLASDISPPPPPPSCTRWFEQDPEEIYQSVVKCLQEVGGALPSGDLSRLKGVGITNQRETTILWDRNTGRCLFNAIVWCDARTAELVERMVGTRTRDRLRVCVPPSPWVRSFLMWSSRVM